MSNFEIKPDEYPFLTLRDPKPTIFCLHNGKRLLLEITSDGEVIADTIEDASEAGKVFVTAIRQQLTAMFGVRPSRDEHIAEGCGDD